MLIIIYLKELEFRAFGILLKVSHISIYIWIQAIGTKEFLNIIKDRAKIIELDEIHSHVGLKNYFYIVDRQGRMSMDFGT